MAANDALQMQLIEFVDLRDNRIGPHSFQLYWAYRGPLEQCHLYVAGQLRASRASLLFTYRGRELNDMDSPVSAGMDQARAEVVEVRMRWGHVHTGLDTPPDEGVGVIGPGPPRPMPQGI